MKLVLLGKKTWLYNSKESLLYFVIRHDEIIVSAINYQKYKRTAAMEKGELKRG